MSKMKRSAMILMVSLWGACSFLRRPRWPGLSEGHGPDRCAFTPGGATDIFGRTLGDISQEGERDVQRPQ